MRSETAAAIIMAHCPPGTYPEQWDVEGFKESVADVLSLQPPIDDWLQEEAVEQELIIERLQAMTEADALQQLAQAGITGDEYCRCCVINAAR